MMHATGERTLEKYNIFPYIAWATILGFSFFVYHITVELRTAAENLNQTSTHLESIVNSQDISKEDFEAAQ